MYMSEISKSKVSGLKAQKKMILWTLKHVSAISEHPVQLSLNHICSEIFEILGVDKQMFISCGQDELFKSPKKAYFSCLIGLYFLSFFYEHPVYSTFVFPS